MSKTVLVTGASTGIGFDSVRVLIENGFQVVATVRRLEDQKKLEESFGEKVLVLQMDVNDFTAVETLPLVLKQKFGITQLDGLVNNAGVALAGPFLDQSFSEIQNMMQTNVISLMKVTHCLLPLLASTPENKRAEGGRIINISSVSGVASLPFLSVYAASKHALEGFSNGLRNELKLLKINVITIGPGSIQTPIWQKGFQIVETKYNNSLYANSFQKFMKMVQNEIEHALPVTEVSACVLDAMIKKSPQSRYAPIPRKFRNRYLQVLLPDWLVDRTITNVLGLNPPD